MFVLLHLTCLVCLDKSNASMIAIDRCSYWCYKVAKCHICSQLMLTFCQHNYQYILYIIIYIHVQARPDIYSMLCVCSCFTSPIRFSTCFSAILIKRCRWALPRLVVFLTTWMDSLHFLSVVQSCLWFNSWVFSTIAFVQWGVIIHFIGILVVFASPYK